jgi:hypothetical protein
MKQTPRGATKKTCTTCLVTKPVDQFSLARNGKAQQKPVRKSKCKACQATAARVWFADNRERSAVTKRRYNLLKNYGLSIENYDAMSADQNGKCLVCGRTEMLHVDHCHATGAIRGLLCGSCNGGLGLFRDDIDLLRKAIDYLER